MKRIRHFFKIFVIAFVTGTFLMVLVLRFVPVYYTPLMFIRVFQQIGNGDEVKLHHKWVPIEEISRHMPVAVMASEDQQFLLHHGFDFNAILKATSYNQKHKKKRGASTISQQTAKNVFLWPGRSWIRKGFEAYFTVLIELVWNKQRIMEVYLNSIEMGPGIYGVQAVAEDNFYKNAIDLTRRECSIIAATLPNPIKFSSKNPSSYILKRSRVIQFNMKFIPSFPIDGEKIDPATVSGGIYKRKK